MERMLHYIFDYHKAFDSVLHRPLLSKLSHLCIDASIVFWVADYLTFRQQKQGSVLDPLLFLIYVNDLASLSQWDHKFLYMQTTSCYFGLSPPKVITVRWGMMWLLLRIVLPEDSLNFNISKCKYMVISRKRTPTTPATPILLNGIPLERVELFRHLGVVVS